MAATALPAHHAHAAPKASSTTIAYVTDVHIDIEDETKTARAKATAAALVDLDPDLVVHGGDLTEYGAASEFATWLDLFPTAFRAKMHHVAGNHESRWDGSAYEAFTDKVGPLNHSVDLDDLHLSFVDLTTTQQEFAHLYEEGRNWLRKDLASTQDRPSLVIGHYPVVGAPYQIRNNGEVLDLLTEAGVSGYLCGHTHGENVTHVNGLTELIGLANQNEAGYYLLTRQTDEDADVLLVERVTIADPTDPEVDPGRREVTTIDLGPRRDDLRPTDSTVEVTDDGVVVGVDLDTDTEVDQVTTMVLDAWKVGGGSIYEQDWTVLDRDGGHWAGTIDLDDDPPGEHRVLIRVVGADGRWWQSTHRIVLPGFEPSWTVRLRGNVQAALARVDDLVVVASAHGEVRAVRPSAARCRPVWHATVGPVHNDPAVGHGRIHLPSADHHVHTLASDTGERLWRTDLGAPVMCDLALATVDDTAVVIGAAMTTLFCLDAEQGSVLWRWEMDQICGGPVSCDGERVYLGGGDGNLWAVDARTGEPLWHLDHSNHNDDVYRRLIWGPWESRTLPLGEQGDDRVLACSRQRLRTSDPATGETLWEIEGHYRDANPQWYGEKILISKEEGQVQLLDPGSGETQVEIESGVARLDKAGLVRDGSRVVVTGPGGRVAAVDLDDGSNQVLGQISIDYVYSTPFLEDDLYVVATMGGELRGYRLPPS